MDTLGKLKNRLPEFVERNPTLDFLLNPIADGIDTFLSTLVTLQGELVPESATAQHLNTIALENGLSRGFHEADEMLQIRVQNGVKTHQRRGSKVGIETEMSHHVLTTPYIRENALILGVDPIGTGFALGGIGAEWIQLWNNTTDPQTDMGDKLKAILPISIFYGIDYVDAYNATGGYKSYSDNDLSGGTLNGFTFQSFGQADGALEPTQANPTYESTVMDLGAAFGDFTWLVDWVDYVKWDVDYTLTVEVQFSADGATGWSGYSSYARNGQVASGTIKRYAQFKLTLQMTQYGSLSDYLFRSFVLKGLDSDQALYQ